MSKRKFLKPAQVLAAAVVTISSGAASATNEATPETERAIQLASAVDQGAQVGGHQLILHRPLTAAAEERLAYHQSHSSHQSHRSHHSHQSHQSHVSHYSSSY